MYVPPQTQKQAQNSAVHNATQGCVLPHVSRCDSKLHFWEPTDNKMEMLNRQMRLKFNIGFTKPLSEFTQNEIMHGLPFWTVFIIRLKFVLQFAALSSSHQSSPFYVTLCTVQKSVNTLNAELNPICCLLALLGAHHFLHVSRIRVKSLTLRLLMSYICIYILVA